MHDGYMYRVNKFSFFVSMFFLRPQYCKIIIFTIIEDLN
jgi:hypothetical protein